MSLAVLFIVVGLLIIIRDRKDWPGYAIIIIGSLYIGQTPAGAMATGWMNGIGSWLDTFVRGLINLGS